MIGRFEGMSDAEWKLVEDIFPDKAKKNLWNACCASAQGFEFAAVLAAAGAIFREAGKSVG